MEKRNKQVLTPEEIASQKTTADAVEESLAAEKAAAEALAKKLANGETEENEEAAPAKDYSTLKYILKLGAVLCILTFTVSLLLAVINELTKDRIAEIATEKLNVSMQTVAPEAVSFAEAEFDAERFPSVGSVFQAMDDSGALCGYVVNVFPAGYGGAIDLVVGVDAEGAVTGVSVNGHSETPGLGALIVKGDFLEQFTGHTADITVVKSGAVGNEINALTGATKSSKAVTTGVNTAIELAVAMQ